MHPMPDKLKVYQPDIITDLLNESTKLSESLRPSKAIPMEASTTSLKRPQVLPPVLSDLAERKAAQLAAKEEQMKEQEREFKVAMQRRVADQAAAKDAEFKAMFSEVLEGLDNDHGVMGETRFTLEHNQQVKSKKKAELYEEWHTQVFDKIQDRILDKVDSRTTRSIESRSRKHYDDYLETVNTKIGVFRDVIIENDYDPLATQRYSVRVNTSDIVDPLKRDMLKPQTERALVGAVEPSIPLGKHTFDNKMWGDLQVHSTPYGHCMDVKGNYVVRPISARALELRKSHIPLDHYNIATGKEALDSEVPPGKRIVPGPEVLRGRKDLFDVISQRGAQEPGTAVGDLWLEHKGKKPTKTPEQLRNLPQFKEVLAPNLVKTKTRTADGQTGDQWLDKKGKRNGMGPEQRRGRRDLTDLMTNATGRGEPLPAPVASGDSWMESSTRGRRCDNRPPPNDMHSMFNDKVDPSSLRPPQTIPKQFQTTLGFVDGALVPLEERSC